MLIRMDATLTLDEAGRLLLPTEVLLVLGMKPGERLRANVTPNRIDIFPEHPVMTDGIIENGVLVMAPLGVKMDAAGAVRAERDTLAGRAIPQ